MPSVLMLMAQEMFRDEEYEQPREVLERRGATVTTTSSEAGPCIGRFGLKAEADLALRDVNAQDYDAVILVGGAGASIFFDDPLAHDLVRAMAAAGKIVSAICVAPSTLAHAGLLQGRRATAYPSREDDLRGHGVLFTGNPVQSDGRIITANGPEAASSFGEAVANALGLTAY